MEILSILISTLIIWYFLFYRQILKNYFIKRNQLKDISNRYNKLVKLR